MPRESSTRSRDSARSRGERVARRPNPQLKNRKLYDSPVWAWLMRRFTKVQ